MSEPKPHTLSPFEYGIWSPPPGQDRHVCLLPHADDHPAGSRWRCAYCRRTWELYDRSSIDGDRPPDPGIITNTDQRTGPDGAQWFSANFSMLRRWLSRG